MEKSLENRIRVKTAIQDGRITDAIAMINDIHPELLDGNRYLHFHLLVSTINRYIILRTYVDSITIVQMLYCTYR